MPPEVEAFLARLGCGAGARLLELPLQGVDHGVKVPARDKLVDELALVLGQVVEGQLETHKINLELRVPLVNHLSLVKLLGFLLGLEDLL